MPKKKAAKKKEMKPKKQTLTEIRHEFEKTFDVEIGNLISVVARNCGGEVGAYRGIVRAKLGGDEYKYFVKLDDIRCGGITGKHDAQTKKVFFPLGDVHKIKHRTGSSAY